MTIVRILLIFLMAFTQKCYCQCNNSDSLFYKFKVNIEILQKEHSGTVGMDTETKESYYLVLSSCSTNDLIKYTNDTNAFVRSYIFAGLLQKRVKKKEILKILEIHKNDTAKFICSSADVIVQWRVNEFMKTLMVLKSEGKLGHINYKKRIEELRNRTSSETAILIEGIHHGLIDKDKLLKNDSLFLTVNKMKIVSFSLYITNSKEIGEFKSSSNVLTNEMKNAIRKAESGTILTFDDLKVVYDDHGVHQLGLMYLKLK